MENGIVPIGKYRGKPLEVMIADTSYVEWILAQAWFVDKYAEMAKLLRMGRLDAPQDTPEHNAMIARLIDQRAAMEALARKLYGASHDFDRMITLSGFGQVIEPKGGDLLISCGIKFLVEAKPSMGDDYPTVIRKLKIGMASHADRTAGNPAIEYGVVICGDIQPTNLSVDQVKRQFSLAGLMLVSEEEFFAASTDWILERAVTTEKELRLRKQAYNESKAAVDAFIPKTSKCPFSGEYETTKIPDYMMENLTRAEDALYYYENALEAYSSSSSL